MPTSLAVKTRMRMATIEMMTIQMRIVLTCWFKKLLRINASVYCASGDHCTSWSGGMHRTGRGGDTADSTELLRALPGAADGSFRRAPPAQAGLGSEFSVRSSGSGRPWIGVFGALLRLGPALDVRK